MKSLKLAVVAMSLIGIFGVGNVMAAEITVTAIVDESCVFDTTAATLAFGVIDPVANGAESTNTAAILYTCVAGTTFTVEDDSAGLYELVNQDDATSVNIPYNLIYATDPLVGVASDGSQGSFDIQATIDAATYGSAKVGDYEDTVILSFNFL